MKLRSSKSPLFSAGLVSSCDWEISDNDDEDVHVRGFTDSDSDSDSDSVKDDDIPPHFSHDKTEFDISQACLVVLDAAVLKQKGVEEYDTFLEFLLLVRFKNCLPLFSHPGDPREGGLLTPIDVQRFGNVPSIAQNAINDYNNLTEKGKLKLEKVVKSTLALWSYETYFMTFSATDTDTGKTSLYQAAIQESKDGGYVLGLLRDCSTDRTLAILSIPDEGAEKALADRRTIMIEGRLCKNLEDAKKEAIDASKNIEDERKEASRANENLDVAKKSPRRVKILKKQGKPVRRVTKPNQILIVELMDYNQL